MFISVYHIFYREHKFTIKTLPLWAHRFKEKIPPGLASTIFFYWKPVRTEYRILAHMYT
jgi:hypothetical protein